MPIEIIPKPETRPEARFSLLGILYYLVLILFILSFAAYFVVGAALKNSQQELEELEVAITEKETKEVRALEQEILKSKEKIETFADLLNSYQKSSNAFNFLRENCHKKVFFSKIELRAKEARAVLSGRAESFRILGEQMLIFQDQDLVKSLSLASVSIGREGGIEFELGLELDPRVFK